MHPFIPSYIPVSDTLISARHKPPEPGLQPEPELEPRERLSTREFLLMIYKGDGAKMLNTAATSFSELRMKVLARWSCPPE